MLLGGEFSCRVSRHVVNNYKIQNSQLDQSQSIHIFFFCDKGEVKETKGQVLNKTKTQNLEKTEIKNEIDMQQTWETNKDTRNRKEKHNLNRRQTHYTTLGMEIHWARHWGLRQGHDESE